MRLQYEHSDRTGKGLDEEVFSDIGEQVSLRQFDISDRRRDRLMALVQVVPVARALAQVVGALAQLGVVQCLQLRLEIRDGGRHRQVAPHLPFVRIEELG